MSTITVASSLVTLHTNSMPEHPESFPVNALVPIPGTPLEGNEVRHSQPLRGLDLPCKWRSCPTTPCFAPFPLLASHCRPQ